MFRRLTSGRRCVLKTRPQIWMPHTLEYMQVANCKQQIPSWQVQVYLYSRMSTSFMESRDDHCIYKSYLLDSIQSHLKSINHHHHHHHRHHVACLTTRPHSLPKRVMHRVRSSAASFSFHCPQVSFFLRARSFFKKRYMFVAHTLTHTHQTLHIGLYMVIYLFVYYIYTECRKSHLIPNSEHVASSVNWVLHPMYTLYFSDDHLST